MPIIKLDAIDSTNDYLKELSRQKELENFTTVTAQVQTNGRGQRGAVWQSESGKNLIMSVLVKDVIHAPAQVFDLNVAVACSVFTVFTNYNIPNISIKWPNDMLSGNHKLGGILIENLIKSESQIEAIVGIGINVNQSNFESLPQASSIYNVLGHIVNTDLLCQAILTQIIQNCQLIANGKKEILWNLYQTHLFKKGVPMPFKTSAGNQFMGIIQAVSANGRLLILRDDASIADLDIKEIQLLY